MLTPNLISAVTFLKRFNPATNSDVGES